MNMRNTMQADTPWCNLAQKINYIQTLRPTAIKWFLGTFKRHYVMSNSTSDRITQPLQKH